MIEIIEKLLMKNRTIVTSDISICMDILKQRYPDMEVLKYPSGNEYQTWPIPDEWNVKKAILSAGDKVIASYEESPLFLAPYSTSFSGTVTKEELIQHTYTDPENPDSFLYEFRLAYNYQRRLNEWRITLPHERVQSLPDGPFQVDIEVETKPGYMQIGELSHQGKSGYWFTFLAHYCHIAQANDGLAGVAVMVEAMEQIKKLYPSPRHNYKALLMPETIGSSVYVATNEDEIDATLGAVFSEMGGAEADLQFVFSRRGDTYIDRVFLQALNLLGKLPCRFIPFRKGWGNDELVFDTPGVGVPAVSIDRHPFEAYHTHHDDMSLVKLSKLEEVVEVLVTVVDILEKDFIPKPKNRVPVYLSKYELYADWTFQREQYDTNILVLDSIWEGLSVLDIALKHNLDFEQVYGYVQKFVDLDLIDDVSVTPEYSRNERYLPSFVEGVD